ncbi:MAG: CHAT domain-containing protein [Planctomycetota bacterium]
MHETAPAATTERMVGEVRALTQEAAPAATTEREERIRQYQLMLDAIQRGDELWKAGDFAGQIKTFEDAAAELSEPSYKNTILLRLANVLRNRGRSVSARDVLREAEAVLMRDAQGVPMDGQQLRTLCYMRGVEAQIYVDWGLIDIAYAKVEELQSLLAKLAESKLPMDAELIQFNWATALVLSAMKDSIGLQRHVASALGHEMYADYPHEAGMLHERLGLTFREQARTMPAYAARARAELELTLSKPFQLADSQRIAPELALAELALRASDLQTAQAWFDKATEHIGKPSERARHPRGAAWAASAARLVHERKTPPADRAELEAARTMLEGTLHARLESWRSLELRSGGYGFLLYPDERSMISELMRLDLVLEPGRMGVERALGRVIATGEVGTLARALGAKDTSLARARSAILGNQADHLLLCYFRAPDQSHLFVVGTDTAEHFPLAGADFIEEKRVAAVDALQRPAESELSVKRLAERNRVIAALGAMLLPRESRPLLEKASRLTVVGLDLFDTVPFEALPWSDEATLGASKAIAHLPSLAAGLVLAERAGNEPAARTGDTEGGVLLLAVPTSSKLDVPMASLERILAPYPKRCRALVTGAHASRERLTKDAPAARVIHILSHGRYELSRERAATILLDAPGQSGGALFGADEIERVDAAPLVVLTACGAGRAPTRRGDGGAADLAGAFFLAGKRARCVALSAFDLDVNAALKISTSFHAALAQGMDPAEALRASNAALAADPDFADPFYHGLMRIVGIGHVPVFAR